MVEKIHKAVDILTDDWDYRFDHQKPQGAIIEAWEYSLATYMHETKISDLRLRRAILSQPMAEGFLYNEITRWAREMLTTEEYCFVYDLGANNTCQEMMAYTLGKAVEDIESRLGPDNWRLGDLVKVRLEHGPLSDSPLAKWFETVTEHSGNRRTV